MKNIKFLISQGVTARQIRRGTIPKRYRHNKNIVRDVKKFGLMLCAVIVKFPLVALDIPTKWNDREDYVLLMYNGLFDNVNGWYTPSPANPTLVIFKGHVDDFIAAQAKVDAKKDDAVNIRNAAWKLVLNDMRLLRGYIQAICISDEDHAEEIASECNMYVVIRSGRVKQEPSAECTGDGMAELMGSVRAQRQATEWEMSLDPTDPSGWNLVRIPPTLAAKTTVTGLKQNTWYWFRSRVILYEGPQSWSEPIKVWIK